jgi:Na+/melibiose symporter-like transporter
MIACVMVLPLAFICGPVRDIPFFWQLIDCSFGVFGFIPLYMCYRKTKVLENVIHNS